MIFFTDSPNAADRLSDADFAVLWEHYHQSNFLYPAKLKRLQSVLARIQQGWPILINAPANLFQIHVAGEAGRIVSSVCAFRDTPKTFMVQHAASSGQPLRMIDCLQSVASGMSATQDAEFVCMFFRLENRWPVRLMQSVSECYSPEHIDLRTQDYLVSSISNGNACASSAKDFGDSVPREVVELATAALGELRTASHGLQEGSDSFQRLREEYARFNIIRDRRIFGTFRDKALAGISLVYITGFPMNFSSLCGRVEILVHPDSADREGIVSELATTAIKYAGSCGQQHITALVDPVDTAAAVSAGFTSTRRQYSNFLWSRERDRGFASTAIAFSHWYGRMEKVSVRQSQA